MIIWPLDDLKISYVDKIVVEGIINKLNEKFEKRVHSPWCAAKY